MGFGTVPRAIDDLEGRITTSLVTPYPPGIPLLIPGEVFNRKIVDYLKFSREFNRSCPGFGTDIHGLVEETGAEVRRGSAGATGGLSERAAGAMPSGPDLPRP